MLSRIVPGPLPVAPSRSVIQAAPGAAVHEQPGIVASVAVSSVDDMHGVKVAGVTVN
jgi:hypothetical protein